MLREPEVYISRTGQFGEEEDPAIAECLGIIGLQDTPSLESAHACDGVWCV